MKNNYKFRAWDDVLLRYLTPMTIEQIGKSDMSTTNWYQLTLEQWTGLYDKNGAEIYVGDVVKSNKSKYTRFNENGIYEVYFNEFLCHYALVDSSVEWNKKHEAYDNYSLTGAKAKDFEVIGNIHEDRIKG